MERKAIKICGVFLLLGVLGPPSAWAALYYHASIDLSGLSATPFRFQVELWDSSGVTGDSYGLIDNVLHGSDTDNFGGGLPNFVADPLNLSSVNVVSANLTGTVSNVMRIDEDPGVWNTIAYRDYASTNGGPLTFDFRMATTDASGQDQLVFSLWNTSDPDPTKWTELVPGLSGLGVGDVLVVSAASIQTSDGVMVTAVPAPAGALLGFLGLTVAGLKLRRFA